MNQAQSSGPHANAADEEEKELLALKEALTKRLDRLQNEVELCQQEMARVEGRLRMNSLGSGGHSELLLACVAAVGVNYPGSDDITLIFNEFLKRRCSPFRVAATSVATGLTLIADHGVLNSGSTQASMASSLALVNAPYMNGDDLKSILVEFFRQEPGFHIPIMYLKNGLLIIANAAIIDDKHLVETVKRHKSDVNAQWGFTLDSLSLWVRSKTLGGLNKVVRRTGYGNLVDIRTKVLSMLNELKLI